MTAIIILAALAYMAPTILGLATGHANPILLALLNIALGWTGYGWGAALIWAWPIRVAAPAINVTVTIAPRDDGGDRRPPVEPRPGPKHEPEIIEAMKRRERAKA